MDLRIYAVSQKLRDNNDMWRYIIDGKDIPSDIVAQAFKDTLETYKDDEAERLVNDYPAFVANHIPLTFSPNETGVGVNGEIDDRALDVIQTLHGKNVNDVVTDAVTNTVQTLSPGREFEIKDIETFAFAVQRRIEENHARVERISQNISPRSQVDNENLDLVDDAPAEIKVSPLERAKRELKLAEEGISEPDPILESDLELVHEIDIEDVPELDDTLLDDAAEATTFDEVEDAHNGNDLAGDEPVNDAGVGAEAWNVFIDSLRTTGLATQMELDYVDQEAISPTL